MYKIVDNKKEISTQHVFHLNNNNSNEVMLLAKKKLRFKEMHTNFDAIKFLFHLHN